MFTVLGAFLNIVLYVSYMLRVAGSEDVFPEMSDSIGITVYRSFNTLYKQIHVPWFQRTEMHTGCSLIYTN